MIKLGFEEIHKRFIYIWLGCLLLISMGPGMAQAASIPLRLDYTVTPTDNNRYHYNFTLTLTNESNSWRSGQGWGAIRFGNPLSPPGPSPLTDFVGDVSSLSNTPFNRFVAPTQWVGPGISRYGVDWVPTAVGQSISWSGTSTADLGQGELYWRPHAGSGGALLFQSSEAFRTNPIPEPGTFVLAGMGLVSLMGLRRRKENP